jgi:hypothetical protein
MAGIKQFVRILSVFRRAPRQLTHLRNLRQLRQLATPLTPFELQIYGKQPLTRTLGDFHELCPRYRQLQQQLAMQILTESNYQWLKMTHFKLHEQHKQN